MYGYDIDSTMVRLGLMNLMMHGIDEPLIDYKDTLSIDKGDINENLSFATTKTELLFVENIYRLLKIGGTACVIVPQGVLFGSGGAFKPYAGVSTAILLFTKVWGPKDKVMKPATEHVWFYEMAADGYSLDDKRSKREGYGDLQDIVAKYRTRNAETNIDRTAKCFMVPRTEIEAEGYDLSLSRYKQDVFEEVHYDAPSVILERLLAVELGADFFNHEKHEKHERHEKVLENIESGIVREMLP